MLPIEMTEQMDDQAKYYVRLWRRVIVDFLGRSEAELEQFVGSWRSYMVESPSTFYHEVPEYYVAPLLVPASLAGSLPSPDAMRLCWAIYPVIGRFDRECGLN